MDLSHLNAPQREAVEHIDGPLLIFAGAGSGKTRVLTHRIAHLVEMGVPAYRILAITFTNKAAREMKERVLKLVEQGGDDVWVGTFHAICGRMLRRDIARLGYTKSFAIYDTDDQKTVVKACLKYFDLSDKYYPPGEVLSHIGDAKNKRLTPEQMRNRYKHDFRFEHIANVYRRYDEQLKLNNALDFDDMINKALELLEMPDLAAYYGERFHYVHVDEYQDTNESQFQLIRALAAGRQNLCVVGDDDQSIYGWRGANIRNILDFQEAFPKAHVIKLEENYRSTGNILKAANAVIVNNTERADKQLWTQKDDGKQVQVYLAGNEHEEAEYICMRLYAAYIEGMRYTDAAVLYRLNSQSRVVEELLMRNGIPYRIYGGTRFYDRREIKDVLAYLRVIANPADSISLRRIINVPKRGIGDTTVDKLMALAESHQVSLFEAIMDEEIRHEAGRAAVKVQGFVALMTRLMAYQETIPLDELLDRVLGESQMVEAFLLENTPEAETRIENIRELQGAVKEYMHTAETPTLADYLENVALVADIDNLEEGQGGVALMTLHSAKGLEFPLVFVVGNEEGIFPHSRAFENENKLEEERRLCYVGITRAETELHLTHAAARTLFGRTSINAPSRFLKELPEDAIERTGLKQKNKPQRRDTWGEDMVQPFFTPAVMKQKRAASSDTYSTGDVVIHNKFGKGTVVSLKGSGPDTVLKIAFDGVGIKDLILEYCQNILQHAE